MVRADFLGLEAVMLNRIELLADYSRILFTYIPDALEVGAMRLGPLGQALFQQGLGPVLEQNLFIFQLGITMLCQAFDLAQVFWMRRVRPLEHLHLAVDFGYSLVIDPARSAMIPENNGKDLLVAQRGKLAFQVGQGIKRGQLFGG